MGNYFSQTVLDLSVDISMKALYWMSGEDMSAPRVSIGPRVGAPVPKEEPSEGPKGSSPNDPILEFEIKEAETVSSEVWTMQYRNMFKWLFWATVAYLPTGLAAMNGDFEAFYWFMMTKRELVPEVVQV